MLELSRSHLDDVIRCDRKYYYKHLRGLPDGGATKAMSEGTILHYGIAAAYSEAKRLQEQGAKSGQTTGDMIQDCRSVGQEAMGQLVIRGEYDYRGKPSKLAIKPDDAETLTRLGDVFDYYMEMQFQKSLEGKLVRAVEQNFSMMLPTTDGEPIQIDGTFDLVLQHFNKPVFEVWDHKSVSLISTQLKFLALDTQMLTYEAIAVKEFIKRLGNIEGDVHMVYNLFRRQVPPGFGHRVLRINKDGSVAKNNASRNPDDYLHQHKFAHDPKELEYIERELTHTAQLIESYHRLVEIEPTAHFRRRPIKTGGEACVKSCPYHALCAAEMVGYTIPNWQPSLDGDGEDEKDDE